MVAHGRVQVFVEKIIDIHSLIILAYAWLSMENLYP